MAEVESVLTIPTRDNGAGRKIELTLTGAEVVLCTFCWARTDRRIIAEDGGGCPGCGHRICLGCGCTDETACVRRDVPDGYPCGWSPLLEGWCTFCSFIIIEQMYAEATT